MTQATAQNTNQPLHAARAAEDARLRVIVSLDVEEEGLFSGRYATDGCTAHNVSLLPRLAPLTRELGFPLSLLCTHAVFMNPDARVTLARMRDSLGAEIGAHLHHWNTPPLGPETSPPIPADQLDADLLRARLRSLLRAGQDFQGEALQVFRMGRWDLKAAIRPLLAAEGIRVDSSVCPLRAFKNGPDHFLAPVDPYWAENGLLEVPITQIALHPWLPPALHAIARALPAQRGQRLLDNFHFWGALSANPVWHSATVMRLAARWHVARGGTVLCLFWHSSEMMPGASPRIRTQEDADALLVRVYDFLRWLKESYGALGVTLASLAHDPSAHGFPARPAGGYGDW
ncbi:MAG: hypothetical protein LBI88_03885 [Deltaproteobacteria bacterium]|jgi:hypothetical protein|nr:hypothetical protein [Deltaproteobacteria bacterium]